MPVPFDVSDVAVLVDEDMPGYATASIAGRTFPVLFRAHQADPLSGIVEGEDRHVLVPETDVKGIQYGSALSVDGVAYIVRAITRGDTGMTRLKLGTA